MNIFFLNSIGTQTWGGGEKWMLTLARGLSQRGHQIYFAGRKQSRFINRVSRADFPVFPLNITGDFSPGNIFRLGNIFRQKKIDVIIANFNKDCRLAGLARLYSRTPVLVARNGLPILQNKWRYRLTYRYLVDGIITNTQAIKNRYLSFGWLPDSFIKVIHNGIAPEKPRNSSREKSLHDFHMPPGKQIIGIFGRLVKQKQHDLFLQTAHLILKEHQDVIFLIVGDGPLRREIETRIEKLQLKDSVFMTGHQTDVMPFYHACDIVLLTSEDEGLPNVVMEAMLNAKPVVAFDVGGIKELIPSDRFGFVVPANNIESLAKKTIAILKEPAYGQEIGNNARNRILSLFSLEKMVLQVEEYLQHLYLKNKKQ